MAKMHGCEIKEGSRFNEPVVTFDDDDEFAGIEYNGDPETVKHLTDDQRKRLTEKLMGKFKQKYHELQDGLRHKTSKG